MIFSKLLKAPAVKAPQSSSKLLKGPDPSRKIQSSWYIGVRSWVKEIHISTQRGANTKNLV
jgi:hypothetical protein